MINAEHPSASLFRNVSQGRATASSIVLPRVNPKEAAAGSATRSSCQSAVAIIVDMETFVILITTFFGEDTSAIGVAAHVRDSVHSREMGARRRVRKRASIGQNQRLLNLETSEGTKEAREN